MNSLPFPNYDNPPVEEVVFGTTFEPLRQFKTPYIGLFWATIKDHFPVCEQAPIVGDFNEAIEAETGLPTPRVWLINETDDHLVQIQKNKFLFNWRRKLAEYPRYDAIYAGFAENFERFRAFVSKNDLGDINVKSYELSYINVILQGESWSSLDKIGQLFPDISWRENSDRFLKNPNNIVWRIDFQLPDEKGIIFLLLQKGLRPNDNYPLLRLEITVKGFDQDPFEDGMKSWFDLAHSWIVRSFEDITSETVQNDVWRKK